MTELEPSGGATLYIFQRRFLLMPGTSSAARNNRANQLNPNNPRHTANRSQQNNPNNAAYWRARGFPDRPADWQERIRRER